MTDVKELGQDGDGMNQSPEKNAGQLLADVTGIIKEYEAKWQKTEEKFNLLKAAGVTRKEVRMCGILAALLNPQGAHYLGSRYLKLFWETVIGPKIGCRVELDYNKSQVITEASTNAGRLDIVITDGKVYLPIEVKIDAGEQPEQIARYATVARARNNGKNIPIFYLTKDGKAPDTAQESDTYEVLSWSCDMGAFLKACFDETPGESLMQSNIAQFIAR
jgi:hypothetical protein